jgi:Helicase associated domain
VNSLTLDDNDSLKVKGKKCVRATSRQVVAEKVESSMATPAPTEAKSAAAPKKQKKASTTATKRRGKTDSINASTPVVSLDVDATPKIQNKRNVYSDDGSCDEMDGPTSNSKASKLQAKQIGQSNQKWDSMLECLVEYANLRRAEETANLSEKDRETWIWDGNVPTNYKSSDGKALGRWVNNQRSAKSKGSLKEDREQRLIDAGLKWSVMASNSWNLMLNELTVYINEQTKKGLTWDGNVPTNYQIKTKLDSEFAGEDKNLGRWVNRQRSMYQAGKLRKARQLELEKIGLKWSMLATTSWDSMFETLESYVQSQTSESSAWDGNVPANFKTDDNPPRSLGRWINRQRSAFIKRKLKKEYVDKLNLLGLKWSVHQRHGENDIDECDEFDSDKDDDILDGEENEGDVDVKKSDCEVSISQIADAGSGVTGNRDVSTLAETSGKTLESPAIDEKAVCSSIEVKLENSESIDLPESTQSDPNDVIAAIIAKAIVDGDTTGVKSAANTSLESQTNCEIIETAMV